MEEEERTKDYGLMVLRVVSRGDLTSKNFSLTIMNFFYFYFFCLKMLPMRLDNYLEKLEENSLFPLICYSLYLIHFQLRPARIDIF